LAGVIARKKKAYKGKDLMGKKQNFGSKQTKIFPCPIMVISIRKQRRALASLGFLKRFPGCLS